MRKKNNCFKMLNEKVEKKVLLRTSCLRMFFFSFSFSKTRETNSRRWVTESEIRIILVHSNMKKALKSSTLNPCLSSLKCANKWICCLNTHGPVSWGYRIHWLHLCRGVRPPPTSVLDMTLNNLMVRFQQCWSFGKCGVPLHCHCSQVHSGPEW